MQNLIFSFNFLSIFSSCKGTQEYKCTNPHQTPDRTRVHSVTHRENETKVLHQPFGFPQDPNVDGLAHLQGSCSDGQGTYSVVNDYASVFFVSFKKERKKSIRFISWGPLPPGFSGGSR